MKRLLAAALLVLIVPRAGHAMDSVSFAASDGSKVYGDVYADPAPAKATILLFHQAGSNRGEYATIAPRLSALGYNVLAIDQRSGGRLWGRTNQTAAERGSDARYLNALPDLEGSLAYAARTWPGTPVIALGSSYSSSLVFFLAAQHPHEIAALLAFSPGEYFEGVSVRAQAAKVQCPVFIASSPYPGEVAEAKRLFDALPVPQKTHFVPVHGTHGASILRLDADPQGAAAAWSAVETFLDALPQTKAGGSAPAASAPSP